MLTMQTTFKLRPLVSHTTLSYTIRSNTYPLLTSFGGRRYSISTSKSEEMLADALMQTTLEERVRLLKIAVKEGADINQKVNNQSVLKLINSYERYEKDFASLTEIVFSLGAKVDYEEYQEGSPLHDALFFTGSTLKKISAVRIYTKYGVDVNRLNRDLATPLDYACYFYSNEEGKDEIIFNLRSRGAVHGFSYHSPERLLPILSIPTSAMTMTMTSGVALYRRITSKPLSKLLILYQRCLSEKN
jgi:hypothetical protein